MNDEGEQRAVHTEAESAGGTRGLGASLGGQARQQKARRGARLHILSH